MKKMFAVIMLTVLCLTTGACGSAASEGSSVSEGSAGSESSNAATTADEGTDGSNTGAESSVSSTDEAKKVAEEQRLLLEAFGSKEFPTSVDPFETEDFDGNTVTEAVFADADVTIFHIWATYCPPCLKEMENLGKMAESLPENAQIIGLCADVKSADSELLEYAKQILEENNVQFTNMVVNDSFTYLLKNVVGVPTTFIVDKEGNIIGEPIVGSDVVGYKRIAKEYLKTLE